jgi:hypothetical protein
MMDVNAWGWPQWLWVTQVVIGLMIVSHLHGKPRTGEYNIALTLKVEAILLTALWQGGFFS